MTNLIARKDNVKLLKVFTKKNEISKRFINSTLTIYKIKINLLKQELSTIYDWHTIYKIKIDFFLAFMTFHTHIFSSTNQRKRCVRRIALFSVLYFLHKCFFLPLKLMRFFLKIHKQAEKSYCFLHNYYF